MMNSLLAGGWTKHLPTILLIVVGAILFIAFVIGFVKGFRKVSWMGVLWLGASAVFALVNKAFSSKLAKALAGALKKTGLKEAAVNAIPTVILAIATVLALALVCGIFALIFRPRYVRVDESRQRYAADEDLFDYDDERVDYDDYDDYRDRRRTVRYGYRKPSFFGRLFGGILCAVNAATIVCVIVFAALLFIEPTRLKTGALAPVYAMKGMNVLLPFMTKYLLDGVVIGIMLWTVRQGYKVGLLETLRVIFVKIGSVAAVVGAFVIPFTKLGAKGWIGRFVAKCGEAAASVGATGAKSNMIVGNLIAGFVFCLAAVLILIILNMLLKLLIDGVKNVGVLRGFDGILAAVVYAVIGIVIAIALFGVAAIARYYFLADLGVGLASEGSLAEQLYEACKAYLVPLFEKAKNLPALIKAKFK